MLIKSKFRPPWWLRNPHAQTIWAAKVLQFPAPITYRERLTTPDGDFVDLDWSDQYMGTEVCVPASPSHNDEQVVHNNEQAQSGIYEPDSPTVVIFHGLTGSSKSPYVLALTDCLNQLGYRSVTMNFRGCSGEPNLKIKSYHSGHTEDISFVIDTIVRRFPNAPISATCLLYTSPSPRDS